MKIIPEANNHVKIELDMSTYAPKRKLDLNEGASDGVRFVDVTMQNPHGSQEDFVVTFTDIENEKILVVTTDTVRISVRQEK